MAELKTIKIFDTTLRDGEQSPGNSMNIEEKLRVAKQLQKLNVDVIEAGFPIASEGDFEAVKRALAAVGYDGYVTAEIMWSGPQSPVKTAAAMKQIFK